MLYGIRRDLQTMLVNAGYRVRVYIPFGREWFPYFMRRLGERPGQRQFCDSRHCWRTKVARFQLFAADRAHLLDPTHRICARNLSRHQYLPTRSLPRHAS